MDSLSYSFGYLQGSSLSNEGIQDIDIQNYVAGLQTGLDTTDTSVAIDQMAMQTLIQTYLQELEMNRQQQAEEEESIELGSSEDDDYEVTAEKRIEEWKQSIEASGQKESNPNFTEIKGDWRERLKRKTAT